MSRNLLLIFCCLLNVQSGEKMNSIDTLQYINNIKENIPLKIFIFFFKDKEAFQNFKKTSISDFMEIIKDLSYFYNLHKNFLLIAPAQLELVGGGISQKILLHNFNSLVGIGIFIISFNGKYQKSLFISDNEDFKKNFLFIIEDDKILIKNGVLSPFEENTIINKIKKS
jgi:hypothetical protein